MDIRNNHVFKGHRALLGTKYVTYGELELPIRYDVFPKSKDGFDWGREGSASTQLAFSILCQLSNEEFAAKYASKYADEVIKSIVSRDWVLSASDVLKWIVKNSDTDEIKDNYKQVKREPVRAAEIKQTKQVKKTKTNIVKEICQKLKITQKNLAEILEVPEGTVSSWAVKNELPRLGKKAIEFYMLNTENQKIVDSYKNFTTLLNKV
jgi:DNA-binding transcriptional regulator YiaG